MVTGFLFTAKASKTSLSTYRSVIMAVGTLIVLLSSISHEFLEQPVMALVGPKKPVVPVLPTPGAVVN